MFHPFSPLFSLHLSFFSLSFSSFLYPSLSLLFNHFRTDFLPSRFPFESISSVLFHPHLFPPFLVPDSFFVSLAFTTPFVTYQKKGRRKERKKSREEGRQSIAPSFDFCLHHSNGKTNYYPPIFFLSSSFLLVNQRERERRKKEERKKERRKLTQKVLEESRLKETRAKSFQAPSSL